MRGIPFTTLHGHRRRVGHGVARPVVLREVPDTQVALAARVPSVRIGSPHFPIGNRGLHGQWSRMKSATRASAQDSRILWILAPKARLIHGSVLGRMDPRSLHHRLQVECTKTLCARQPVERQEPPPQPDDDLEPRVVVQPFLHVATYPKNVSISPLLKRSLSALQVLLHCVRATCANAFAFSKYQNVNKPKNSNTPSQCQF